MHDGRVRSYGVTDDVPRRLVLEMCEESLAAALHSASSGAGAAVAAALSGDAAAMARSRGVLSLGPPCVAAAAGASAGGSPRGCTPLLTLQQRLLVAGDVAAGLAHMHSRDVVHFDVKVRALAAASLGGSGPPLRRC